jgi:hypothetical protein
MLQGFARDEMRSINMNTHDRNFVLMMFVAAVLVSLNVLAVITGAADGYYESITEFLHPLLMTS